MLFKMIFGQMWDMLQTMNGKLNVIHYKEKLIMNTLAEVKAMAEVAVEKINVLNTALDGYREVVAGLKQQIEDLKSGHELPAAVQAEVDSIAAKMAEVVKGVEDTLAENFPAEPPPPVEPPVEV